MKLTTLGLAALSLALFTTNLAHANDSKWAPYIGVDAGIDFVSTVRFGTSNDDAGAVDLSIKPGAAFGLEAGFTHGNLFLGAELRYSQAKIDTFTWYADGTAYEKLPATDGQLRQLTLAPTIGYRLFTKGKLSMDGQLTAGWLLRKFANVKHDDFENSTASVLDDAKSTWLIKPSLVIGYALSERSTIKLRYAYAFSGTTKATDLSVDDEDEGDPNPNVSAIKTHSLSVGYSYQF